MIIARLKKTTRFHLLLLIKKHRRLFDLPNKEKFFLLSKLIRNISNCLNCKLYSKNDAYILLPLPRAPQGLKLDKCGRFYFLFFYKIKCLNLLVKFSCFCNVLEIWKYLTKHIYMVFFCSTKKDNFDLLSKN